MCCAAQVWQKHGKVNAAVRAIKQEGANLDLRKEFGVGWREGVEERSKQVHACAAGQEAGLWFGCV
jgi:hypothetical protein